MKQEQHIKMARQRITGLMVTTFVLLALCTYWLPKLPSSPMLRDSFWAHKINAKPVYDIVLVGDSRIYRGLDPDIVKKNFGPNAKCFNYGFSAAGLDSFLLGRAAGLLKPGGLKVMIIGICANSFTEESMQNGHLHSLLKWNPRDLWIREHLYPALTRFDAFRISDFYNVYKGQGYFEDYHLNTGWAGSYKLPPDSNAAIADYTSHFARAVFLETGVKAFFSYISVLQSRGITVYTIRIPTSFAMRNLEEEWMSRKMGPLDVWMASSGIKIIDPGPGPYTSYDGSHLDRISAEKLSAMIKP